MNVRERGGVFDGTERQQQNDQAGDVNVDVQIVLRVRFRHLA